MKPGEWWDITANAFRGCSHASPGCEHCWAERMAWRLKHNPNREISAMYEPTVAAGRWTGKTTYDPYWALGLPNGPKRRRVFFNGMGDMFHEANRPSDVQDCMEQMRAFKHLLFIVATKRPETAVYHLRIHNHPMPNMILLSSVEHQGTLDARLQYTLDCKPYVGAIGLSVEPMLGPLDISDAELRRLDWVICGGETGHMARGMKPAWAEALLRDCRRAKTPFFFKQWGKLHPGRRILLGEPSEGPELWRTF